MQKLPAVDVAVLLAYLAAVVTLGCWFVRRSRTTEGFMAAGRSLPGWAVGLSIFGTYLSSNTFIGVPGTSYGGNWNRFVFSLSLPIAAVIAVRWFVPFYRRSGEISAYHHLERRFGVWARTYAMTCYLLLQLARMGTIMFGVSLALHALVGWPVATIILATGILVTLYTLLGGIEAVIWTDVVQSIVLTAGAVVVLVLLLMGMPEGPGQVFSIAAESHKFSLGSFSAAVSVPTFWVVLTYGLVINLNNFGIDQSFVQRYHTARSDREAAKSVWLGAFLYVPVSAVFFFIGTALFAYYQTQPAQTLNSVRLEAAGEKLEKQGLTEQSPNYARRLTETAAALKPKDYGDKVLPYFIVTKLPPGVAGLLLAAILAAAMSSIDTSLNSSATIVLSDFYRRFLRPDAGERESMIVLYTATLTIGAVGTAAALAMIGVKSVLDTWWTLSGILAGGMVGLFLLGLISRWAKNAAAVTAVVVGVLVTVWMTIGDKWPDLWTTPFHKFMIPVVGTATIVLTGALLGFIGHYTCDRPKRHP